MNPKKSEAKRFKWGQRHPLLLQQYLNEEIFWVALLLLLVSGGLLLWNPVEFEPYRPHLSAILVGTGMILVLTFLFRLRAYVQCRKNELRVQLPFYRFTIPYRQIKATRPASLTRLFPKEEQRWTQRRFLRWLWGQTVIVIELNELPHPELWLRLWMSKYLLSPEEVGLVLAVRDWLALRTELDESVARERRRQQPTVRRSHSSGAPDR
ncbi:MAG: hypothetical protein PVH17_11670 [Anaerolineae bacterium]|jgi:hypothetical protein